MLQPYDCGFFLTRTTLLSSTFQNPNAAYLPSSQSATIPSPMNNGLENSRRFRALPVYAVLVSYGCTGFSEIFAKQVRLARAVARFIDKSEGLELLVGGKESGGTESYQETHIIVIFRAKDEAVNDVLVQKINETRRIYVSGTKWQGKKACRIAVSTWRVDVDKDLKLVSDVLRQVSGG